VLPGSFYSPADVVAVVAERVRSVIAAGNAVDYLTFVPDGEPTLDIGLAEEITLLRPLGIDVAVITNASLISRPDVRATLALADWVSVKVDTVDEAIWRRVNHPHQALHLETILSGITAFSRDFDGVLTTETMLVAGVNNGAESIRQVADFVAGLDAAVSYISVPTRPPAVRGVRPPSAEAVNAAFQLMRQRLPQVEMLIGYEGDDFASTGDPVADLLSICAVHPMRRSAVESLLAQTGANWDTVRALVADGRLVETDFAGHRYYLRPIAALNSPGS
jgi:wyosine [tRNA(Phe)-imidazoG37] synthetase (radical SAM superfamily)